MHCSSLAHYGEQFAEGLRGACAPQWGFAGRESKQAAGGAGWPSHLCKQAELVRAHPCNAATFPNLCSLSSRCFSLKMVHDFTDQATAQGQFPKIRLYAFSASQQILENPFSCMSSAPWPAPRLSHSQCLCLTDQYSPHTILVWSERLLIPY